MVFRKYKKKRVHQKSWFLHFSGLRRLKPSVSIL